MEELFFFEQSSVNLNCYLLLEHKKISEKYLNYKKSVLKYFLLLFRTSLQFSIVILSCLLALHTRSLAQVTFSKDWNAGKRAIPQQPSECIATIKPSMALCQMFLVRIHIYQAKNSENDFVEILCENSK